MAPSSGVTQGNPLPQMSHPVAAPQVSSAPRVASTNPFLLSARSQTPAVSTQAAPQVATPSWGQPQVARSSGIPALGGYPSASQVITNTAMSNAPQANSYGWNPISMPQAPTVAAPPQWNATSSGDQGFQIPSSVWQGAVSSPPAAVNSGTPRPDQMLFRQTGVPAPAYREMQYYPAPNAANIPDSVSENVSRAAAPDYCQQAQHLPSDRMDQGRRPVEEVLFQPFVPLDALKPFDGTEEPLEAKAWLKKFKYVAQAGGWKASQKCANMEIYLQGAAASWLIQLGRSRHLWDSLESLFKDEFCHSRTPPSERYYTLRQKSNETARQYLWRLNAAADRAHMDVSSVDGLGYHVSRFIKTLTDDNVRRALIGNHYRSVSDLEETLRLFEQQFQEPRAVFKPKHVDKPVPKPRQAETYWTYDSDYVDPRVPVPALRKVQFPDDDEEDSDEEVEFTAQTFQVMGEKPRIRDGRPAMAPRSRAPPSAPRAAPESPVAPGTRVPMVDPNTRCFGCGGRGHFLRECPNPMVCNACEKLGHVAEDCPNKCKRCKKAHPKGECPALEVLSEWVKNHADVEQLPDEVKQLLN